MSDERRRLRVDMQQGLESGEAGVAVVAPGQAVFSQPPRFDRIEQGDVNEPQKFRFVKRLLRFAGFGEGRFGHDGARPISAAGIARNHELRHVPPLADEPQAHIDHFHKAADPLGPHRPGLVFLAGGNAGDGAGLELLIVHGSRAAALLGLLPLGVGLGSDRGRRLGLGRRAFHFVRHRRWSSERCRPAAVLPLSVARSSQMNAG